MKTHSSASHARSFSRRVVLESVLLAGALLVLSGCAHKSEVNAGGEIAGQYRLVSVNGANVPTTISHEGVKLEVRSGMFTISSDGSCGSKMDFVPPSGAVATREVKATYKREGSKLTMRWEGAGTTVGNVKGDEFTMNNEGMILAYRRQ